MICVGDLIKIMGFLRGESFWFFAQADHDWDCTTFMTDH